MLVHGLAPLNILTADEVLQFGLELVGYQVKRQVRIKRCTRIRRFKSHFGSDPLIISVAWENLQTTLVYAAWIPYEQNKMQNFKDFMMTQYYLKGYPVEESVASRFQVHEQTARKWIGFYT